MPPGSASISRRAAMLTPSPKMSSSSTITSPRLMPMRNCIHRAGETSVLRRAIRRWISVRTAPRRRRCELDQHAVTGGLDDAAAIPRDGRIDEFEPIGLEAQAFPSRRPPSADYSRPCRRRAPLRACALVPARPSLQSSAGQPSRWKALAQAYAGRKWLPASLTASPAPACRSPKWSPARRAHWRPACASARWCAAP